MNKETACKYNNRIYLRYKENVIWVYKAVMYPNTMSIHDISINKVDRMLSGKFHITVNPTSLTGFSKSITGLIAFGHAFYSFSTVENVKDIINEVFYDYG